MLVLYGIGDGREIWVRVVSGDLKRKWYFLWFLDERDEGRKYDWSRVGLLS